MGAAAPIDPRVESLKYLRSIDASLKTLITIMRAGGGSASSPAIASDAELDGQYGDPEVRAKDPRDWSGAPMKGRKFSECPAEYLDMLADRFDYFAENEDDKKKAGYCRKDAARARGWAKRIRAGLVPEKAAETVAAGASIFDGGFEDPEGEAAAAAAGPGEWGY